MKRSYLTVFERLAVDNWSAFIPDVSGAVGAGDSFEQARESVLEGAGYMLEDLFDRGLEAPPASSTQVDFTNSDQNPERRHFVVEWLSIELPRSAVSSHEGAQQAA